MKSTRLKVNGETVYLCAFLIYYVAAFVWTTMFKKNIPAYFLTAVGCASMALLMVKMVWFDTYRYNKVIVFCICGLVVISTFLSSGYGEFVIIVLFIVAAQNVSFDKVLKISLVCGCFVILVALVASQAKIIQDLVYIRSGKSRHSFGSIYPTDFAAHIFFLSLTHFYLKRGRLSFLNICVYLGLAAFLDVFCNTRLDELLILFLVATSLLYRSMQKKMWTAIRNTVLTWSVSLCGAISLLLCAIYDPSVGWMAALNTFLSGRLRLGKSYLSNLSARPFGMYVEQHGNGGTTESLMQRHLSYTYIDISYMRVLFMYGYVVLLFVCVAYVFFCRTRLKKGDILLPICIFMVAMSSMVDQHMFDFSYNIFTLCFLMRLYDPKTAFEGVTESEFAFAADSRRHVRAQDRIQQRRLKELWHRSKNLSNLTS